MFEGILIEKNNNFRLEFYCTVFGSLFYGILYDKENVLSSSKKKKWRPCQLKQNPPFWIFKRDSSCENSKWRWYFYFLYGCNDFLPKKNDLYEKKIITWTVFNSTQRLLLFFSLFLTCSSFVYNFSLSRFLLLHKDFSDLNCQKTFLMFQIIEIIFKHFICTVSKYTQHL
jgi:hypothetical protein